MSLPIKPLPTDSIEINGEQVAYRSLSRSEAMKVTTQFRDNPDGAELFVLMCGTGATEDEAKAFRDGTELREAGKLVDAILAISALAPKDAATADE